MSQLQGECQRAHPNCFAQPYALKGVYGHISSFEMSLHRRFAHAGKVASFVSADCPARGSLPGVTLPLVKTVLDYARLNGEAPDSVSGVASRQCKVSR